MKIRIKGNSLRYRLTKSEVTKLWEQGFLEEQTSFPSAQLIYAIETGGSNKLSADIIENKIVLFLSKTMIDELYNTDRVGFEENSDTMRLLVEKDFVCIDNTTEDQSDNYPNPSINCN